ncbi:DUF2232 domain-containing protein [Bacillus sp. CLL-7-23]|uniref:DUF2232 domain-containing protein n=1 Tax=Bacillus changyiensis TaxID=3004103 RepID=A0ABT4X0X5_9BACI|nr:DUF2232 domain-containing protein [Bacillus changyiensis]MDA7025071.1 DUF2232 domain-containing protein [Bacillus changyiensis]
MKQTRALIEGAILVSLFTVLMFITQYAPLVGMLTLFLLPLPVIIQTIRHGIRSGLLMGLASLPITFMISSLNGLGIAIPTVSVGVVMGYHYRQKEPGRAIASGAVMYMISLVLMFIISIQFFGLNLIDMANQSSHDLLKTWESMYQQFGNKQETEKQMAQLREQMKMTQYLYPIIIILTSAIIAFINHLMARPLLQRFTPQVPALKPFRELKLPQSVFWLYLLTILVSLAPAEQGSVFNSIVLNASILMGLIVAMQGFSFIFYYCHVKKISKVVPVLFFIIGLLSPLLYLVRILGIIDIGFNLRERVKK